MKIYLGYTPKQLEKTTCYLTLLGAVELDISPCAIKAWTDRVGLWGAITPLAIEISREAIVEFLKGEEEEEFADLVEFVVDAYKTKNHYSEAHELDKLLEEKFNNNIYDFDMAILALKALVIKHGAKGVPVEGRFRPGTDAANRTLRTS